jgi:hypothetical protein
MRVTQESPTLLEAHRDQWAPFIIGALLVAAGLGAIALHFTTQPGKNLWVLGGLLVGFGAIVLGLVPRIHLSIDKDTGQFILRRTTLFLGTREVLVPLTDIREVVVDEQIQQRTDPNGQDRMVYHLIFQMKDGTQQAIDITPSVQFNAGGLTSSRFVKNNKAMAVGNQIAAFIEVPCVDRRQATLGDMTNAIGQVIDAARGRIDKG